VLEAGSRADTIDENDECMTTNRILALVLVAIAGAIGACGGDGDHSSSGPSASQAETSTSRTSQAGDGRSAGGRDGRSTPADRGGGDGASSGGDSGGSGAPRALPPPRKRSLQRYLARRYRVTPWYPLLRKLQISGGHVNVYLKFPSESDDEGPPVLACNAVSSYGKRVTGVTVYGSPTPQGKTNLLQRC